MFKNIFPYFKSGSILKQEMLENLRDYPRKFFNLYFSEYSDGIISGSNISIDGDYICIEKGIIKFKDIIYILDNNTKIEYFNSNKEVMIKIAFSNFEETRNFKNYESRIFLDEDLILKENELELGRFKLRKGAKLRASYRAFSDFYTEYNTINIINVAYSNLNKSTLHPLIIKKFAQILLKKSSGDTLDIAFAMQCLNSRLMDRDLIVGYLANKSREGQKDYSNLEIYINLRNIIKDFSFTRTREGRKQSRGGPTKIIVD